MCARDRQTDSARAALSCVLRDRSKSVLEVGRGIQAALVVAGSAARASQRCLRGEGLNILNGCIVRHGAPQPPAPAGQPAGRSDAQLRTRDRDTQRGLSKREI